MALMALIASPAGAAQWSVQYSAQMLTQLESNPRLQPDYSQESRSAALEGAVAVRRSMETESLALSASGNVRRYSGDQSLDRDEQRVNLGWQRDYERWRMAAALDVVRDSTLNSELGGTGLTQTNLRHRQLTATVTPEWRLSERTRTGVSVGWLEARYPGGQRFGLSDYRYVFTSANMDREVSEKATVSVQINASELKSEAIASATHSLDARLALRYTWNPRWSGSLSGGPTRVSSGTRNQGGSVFGATLTRGTDRSALSASLGRGVSPTGRGLLSRRDQASLTMTGLLTRSVDASVGLAYLRTREYLPTLGLALGDVRYLRAEGSVFWRALRDWSVGLTAGHSRQNQRLQDLGARGLDARLQIAWRRSSLLG
jgi:hypothetical protein